MVDTFLGYILISYRQRCAQQAIKRERFEKCCKVYSFSEPTITRSENKFLKYFYLIACKKGTVLYWIRWRHANLLSKVWILSNNAISETPLYINKSTSSCFICNFQIIFYHFVQTRIRATQFLRNTIYIIKCHDVTRP